MTHLKMEAGETNLAWAKLILDVASQLPGFPVPGPITKTIQILLEDLKSTRHYWESKLSVKFGDKIAIDDYSSSDKTKKLIAAQAVLLAPELELCDESLGYDKIRHNYKWQGRLIEIQESIGPSTKDCFCVVHPDPDFQPISLLGNVRVVRSCTEQNPNYANVVMRTPHSHQQRMEIINKRRALLEEMS